MSVSRFGLKNIGLVYSVFSPSVYKTKQSADRFENQSTVRCEIFWSEVFSLQRFFTFFCFFQAKIEELEEELEAERNARSKVCCGFIFLTPSMGCSSSNTS